jgi:hypothetical protein
VVDRALKQAFMVVGALAVLHGAVGVGLGWFWVELGQLVEEVRADDARLGLTSCLRKPVMSSLVSHAPELY